MIRLRWRRFLYSQLFDSLCLWLALSVSLMSWLRVFFDVIRPIEYAFLEAVLALALGCGITARIFETGRRRPRIYPLSMLQEPGESDAPDNPGS